MSCVGGWIQNADVTNKKLYLHLQWLVRIIRHTWVWTGRNPVIDNQKRSLQKDIDAVEKGADRRPGYRSWTQTWLELRPVSNLRFYHAITSCDKVAVCNCACCTLQVCHINKNRPISVHNILMTKLHRIELCSIRKRSCTTVNELRDMPMSHLRFCHTI